MDYSNPDLSNRHQIISRFFEAVLEIAEEYGGSGLVEKYTEIKRVREQYMQVRWQQASSEQEKIFYREIDYDHLMMLIRAQLAESFPALVKAQIAITGVCLQFGEYRKAESLITYLKKTMDEDHPALFAEVLMTEGKWAFLTNDFPLSETAYSQALSLFEEQQDVYGQFRAHNNLGIALQECWEIEKGKQHFLRAQELLDELDSDLEGLIQQSLLVQMNLGIIDGMQGWTEEAAEIFARVLREKERMDRETQVTILINQGLVYRYLEQYDHAIASLTGALTLAREVQNQRLVGSCILALAEVRIYQGAFDQAEKQVWEAFNIFSQLYDRVNLAEAYRVFGVLYREQGDLEMANSDLHISLNISQEYGDLAELLEVYYDLSLLAEKQQDPAQQKTYLEQALSYAESMKATPRIKHIQEHLARIKH
ncbi:MAG TPA: hypothetical protein VKA68_16595 [bacterium]|nr:hypothetical protein [bacterium]